MYLRDHQQSYFYENQYYTGGEETHMDDILEEMPANYNPILVGGDESYGDIIEEKPINIFKDGGDDDVLQRDELLQRDEKINIFKKDEPREQINIKKSMSAKQRKSKMVQLRDKLDQLKYEPESGLGEEDTSRDKDN